MALPCYNYPTKYKKFIAIVRNPYSNWYHVANFLIKTDYYENI